MVFVGKKYLEFENLYIYLQENTYLHLFPLITLVFVNPSKSIDSLSPIKIALLIAVTRFLHITANLEILSQAKNLPLLELCGAFLPAISFPLFFIVTLVLLKFIGIPGSNAVYSLRIDLVLILKLISQNKTAAGLSTYLLNKVSMKCPELIEKESILESLSKVLPK
jgi:hypothetical protein